MHHPQSAKLFLPPQVVARHRLYPRPEQFRAQDLGQLGQCGPLAVQLVGGRVVLRNRGFLFQSSSDVKRLPLQLLHHAVQAAFARPRPALQRQPKRLLYIREHGCRFLSTGLLPFPEWFWRGSNANAGRWTPLGEYGLTSSDNGLLGVLVSSSWPAALHIGSSHHQGASNLFQPL